MIPGPHFFIEILQIIYLVICHYLNIASRFADRLILLSKGVIGADGTSEEVITKENIKNVYDMDTEIITVDESPISSTMPTRITTWDAVRDTWDRPRDNMTYDAILMIRGGLEGTIRKVPRPLRPGTKNYDLSGTLEHNVPDNRMSLSGGL